MTVYPRHVMRQPVQKARVIKEDVQQYGVRGDKECNIEGRVRFKIAKVVGDVRK